MYFLDTFTLVAGMNIWFALFCLDPVKSDEEVYLQLQTFNNKLLNVLRLLWKPIEITNCLQVRTTNVFFIIVFRIRLLPYLGLTTTGMKQDTLIEHKEVVVVCD